MEGDQTRIFREKLSQWIASQGFWFQLRHSMQGGGGWSMTVYHLVRVAIRCLIVLVVVAGAFGLYLFKRTSSKSYQEGIAARVTAALGAKEATVQDFGRDAGDFKIRQFAAEGTSETFFNKLDASLIQFRPNGFLGGIVGGWDVGTIRVGQLNANLRAGADSAAEAVAMGKSLTQSYPDFTFSGLDVQDASFVWGLTTLERHGGGFSTQGRIDNSHLKAVRSSTGSWHLEFSGGTFTQNWLTKATIIALVADCDASGIRVSKADFNIDSATISLSDLTISGGEKPAVSGRMSISRLDLLQILPGAVKEFMEGSISGDFKLSGAINTSEGIVAEGDVKLDGRDLIRLRDRLPIFNAMSVLDNYHSYRKVEFNEGTFHLRTSADRMVISGVDLKSGELMTLKGNVSVRQPNTKEMAEGPPILPAAIGLGPNPGATDSDGDKKAGDISLKDAAKMSGKKQGFGSEGGDDLYDRHAQERMSSQVNQEAVARFSRTMRYEGNFSLSLPPDAFERADVLRAKYPPDEATKRIPLEIPVDGQVGEISIHLSESLLQEGARK
jgi:hypothetical protein